MRVLVGVLALVLAAISICAAGASLSLSGHFERDGNMYIGPELSELFDTNGDHSMQLQAVTNANRWDPTAPDDPGGLSAWVSRRLTVAVSSHFKLNAFIWTANALVCLLAGLLLVRNSKHVMISTANS